MREKNSNNSNSYLYVLFHSLNLPHSKKIAKIESSCNKKYSFSFQLQSLVFWSLELWQLKVQIRCCQMPKVVHSCVLVNIITVTSCSCVMNVTPKMKASSVSSIVLKDYRLARKLAKCSKIYMTTESLLLKEIRKKTCLKHTYAYILWLNVIKEIIRIIQYVVEFYFQYPRCLWPCR